MRTLIIARRWVVAVMNAKEVENVTNLRKAFQLSRTRNQQLEKRAALAIKEAAQLRTQLAKQQATFSKKYAKLQQAFQQTERLNRGTK